MTYQLYFQSGSGQIRDAKLVDCPSDTAVRLLAEIEALRSGLIVEAWEGSRCLSRFDPAKGAIQQPAA